VATVPGDFGWTDVGDFDTLGQVLTSLDNADDAQPGGNVVVVEPEDAPILMRDTTESVIVSHSGRLVVTLGLDNTIVVDTPDALLVCGRKRAQDIKSIVEELKQRGEGKYA
jgi:mannose-1-phosphate guanylyltransferase